VEWTPDSRSVLVVKALSADSDLKELWQVPIDGREARRLNIDINRWLAPDGGFRLSPDGKRIVFVEATGRTGQEIWALENFLPASRSARR
jgi:Tol biopolymer transport system component